MRILYLASVAAINTGASHIVLRRHLDRLAKDHDLAYVCDQAGIVPFSRQLLLHKTPWMSFLVRTRHAGRVAELNEGLALGFDLIALRRLLTDFRPEVILTVALGPLHVIARRLAERHSLPLVTIYHDWAPAWFVYSPLARRLTARQLLNSYQASDVCLCITEEFRAKLGADHPGGRVLAPIPGGLPYAGTVAPPPARLAVYAGASHGVYQAQAVSLVETLMARPPASLPDLCFFGPQPRWPDSILTPARDRGLLRGFLERDILDQNLAGAPALLVIVPFAPEYESIARYSFPSKLVEYCRFGRPIVLWTPAYSAAAAWARGSGAALIVDSPSPVLVLETLEALTYDSARAAELGLRALACSNGEFSPEVLHRDLVRALTDAIAKHAPRLVS